MENTTFTTTQFPDGLGRADTNGWDTIYAVKVPFLNDTLRAHFAQRKDDATVSVETRDGALNGTIRHWQIVRGNGGTTMKIAVTFDSGVAEMKGFDGSTYRYDIAGAHATAKVTLGFHANPLGASNTADGQSTRRADLKIAFDSTAQPSAAYESLVAGGAGMADAAGAGNADEDDEPPVTVHEVKGLASLDGAPAPDHSLERLLGGILEDWFNDHPEIFDFVFLSVDIAENPPRDFAWVTPTYVSYTVADSVVPGPTGVDFSVFAVLGMTGKEQPSGLSTSIPAGAIPINEGVNAAFLISPRLVLEHMLRPNLPALFGTTSDAFSLSNNGLALANTRELHLQLNVDKETIGDNFVDATIPVDQFRIELGDTELIQEFQQLNFVYGADNELNVQMSLGARSRFGIDGGGRFAMQMLPNPRSSMTATPIARKVAFEALESIGITVLSTALLSLGAEALALRAASRAAGTVAKGAETVVQDVEAAGSTLKTAEQSAKTLTEEVVVEVEDATTTAGAAGKTVTVDMPPVPKTLALSTVEPEAVQTVVNEVKAGSKWQLKDLLRNFLVKSMPMVIANLVGSVWGQISSIDIIRMCYEKAEEIPELAEFGTRCVSSCVWTQSKEARLICAGLNGAFVLGFAIAPPAPTANGPAAAQAEGVRA